ncbi:MAG TPA: glycosyltransferase family 2 protein [Verrucomicrobiae bacterium]|nr:glycosyltransferase family 2 protein [Verrucomicrobiae bacterium]
MTGTERAATTGDAVKTAAVVAVVLNWNGFRDTQECLESLRESTITPAAIVVCDNGSIDGSFERLKEWAASRGFPFVAYTTPNEAFSAPPSSAQLVFVQIGANLGYAGGNNVGLRYALESAGAEYVWILNNDVVVDRAALESMLILADGDASIGMVGSTMLRYDQPNRVQVLGGGNIVLPFCHDTQIGAGCAADRLGGEAFEVGHLIGANLLVRAAALRDVGPIDESYFLYREETDWCIRMRARGWRLLCCTSAKVWHKQSRSIGFKSPLHDYYAVRNMLRLVKKYYRPYLPAAFAYIAARALLPKLLRLEIARTAAVCSAVRDFFGGVEGRPAHHTDAVFVGQYIAKEHGRILPRRTPQREKSSRASAAG